MQRHFERLEQTDPLPVSGRVVRTVGLLVESQGPRARIGDLCELAVDGQQGPLILEVVGFKDGHLLTVPLGGTAGIRPGDWVVARSAAATFPVGDGLLGRVIDGLGQTLDGLGADAPQLPYGERR